MTITKAPAGWRDLTLLSEEEIGEMLGGDVKQRKAYIIKFASEVGEFPLVEIFQFITNTMEEYLQVVPQWGVPAYTEEEAVWLAYVDLLWATVYELYDCEVIF